MFEAMLPALMQGLSSPMAQAGIGLMSGMPMGQAMQMGNRKPQGPAHFRPASDVDRRLVASNHSSKSERR